MTSRDLTENVEQLQIWKSMQIIRDKAVAVLNRMSALAEQWKHVTIAGRTHNVAAQTTTMGKRVAMFGKTSCTAWGPGFPSWTVTACAD